MIDFRLLVDKNYVSLELRKMDPRTRGCVHCKKQLLDCWKILFLQMHSLLSKLATQLPFVFDSPDLIYGNYHQAHARERIELRDRKMSLQSKIKETIVSL